MKKYMKPVIIANDSLAEGVYAASGATAGSSNNGGDCYTVTANIHQTPETGREDYRIQVDAKHAAADSHHGGIQQLIISFNQPVHYISCNGNGASLAGGDGSTTLTISFSYHQNGNDNIGFGDLVVTSEPGLAITGAIMTCNHDCFQH